MCISRIPDKKIRYLVFHYRQFLCVYMVIWFQLKYRAYVLQDTIDVDRANLSVCLSVCPFCRYVSISATICLR